MAFPVASINDSMKALSVVEQMAKPDLLLQNCVPVMASTGRAPEAELFTK